MTAVLEDPAVPHQIVLRSNGHRGHELILTCTCQRVPRDGRAGYRVIEQRSLFPAADAIAAWRDWHARRNITV